jgi:hypothetical protein
VECAYFQNAVARQLRRDALDEALADYQSEFGAPTPEEIAQTHAWLSTG